MTAKVAAALLLLALWATACGGQSGPASPPTPNAAEPFIAVFRRALPGVDLRPNADLTYSLAGDARWTVAPIMPTVSGRGWGTVAFFALRGPAGGQAPGLGLPPGVYALFTADNRSWLLSPDASSLRPAQEALRGGTQPLSPDAAPAVAPALATDADDDGQDELVLALQPPLASPSRYLILRRADGESWQRLDGEQLLPPPPVVPAQAVLNYWSAIGAGLDAAARWDAGERLRIVWPWLQDQVEAGLPIPEAMLQELTGTDDPAVHQNARAALERLRSSFREAYSTLSSQFQERQPWPGFVNSFRNTERVRLEEISPPAFSGPARATLETVVTLQQWEGEELVPRRFLVTFALVTEESDRLWRLNDVNAEQLPPS